MAGDAVRVISAFMVLVGGQYFCRAVLMIGGVPVTDLTNVGRGINGVYSVVIAKNTCTANVLFVLTAVIR